MASLALQADALQVRRTPAAWQIELARSVRDVAELCRLVGLGSAVAEAAGEAANGFPVLVPRPYLARIQRGDAANPLLKQVLPSPAELDQTPGFTADPLGEAARLCAHGLLWKYQNRVLMVSASGCAVHCRFCFRRHFLCNEGIQSPKKWGEVLERIAAEPSFHEVILSGGDPLILPDDELARLSARLEQIPHVRRLRIHTRMPIVIPQRVCDELVSWMKGTRLSTLMVVHINHPAEIDGDVAAALGRLIDAGVPLLSQSVLLAGVNDDLETLMELYERLADLRVMPYYLHQLDPVAGAAHFEVPVVKGKELVAGLRKRLPGYAVPRYVRETPGGEAKEMLC
jgi:EF-P beta-lysylation protein EpmB